MHGSKPRLHQVIWLGLLVALAPASGCLGPSLTSDDDSFSLVMNGFRQQGYEVSGAGLAFDWLGGWHSERGDVTYVSFGVGESQAVRAQNVAEEGDVAILLVDDGAPSKLDRFGIQTGQPILSTEGNASVVEIQSKEALVHVYEPVELAVSDTANVTVLASVGESFVKDASQTGRIDEGDPQCKGGCPLVVQVDHGEGEVIVIGDTTFATNRYAQGSGAIPFLLSISNERATGQAAKTYYDLA